MEKKYYTVTAKTKEDKCSLKHDLSCRQGYKPNVPDRACECGDHKNFSKTRATYLLTDHEASMLRLDERVKAINLDKRFYEDMIDDIVFF